MNSTSDYYTLDILFYKKEIEIKKSAFRPFYRKQNCSVFTSVQYRKVLNRQKASTHVSLCGMRRLKWGDTFPDALRSALFKEQDQFTRGRHQI